MKTIMNLLVLVCMTFSIFAQGDKTSLLVNLQEKIDSCFVVSYKEKDVTPLLEVEKSIDGIKMNNYLPQYWGAYLKLNLSIMYSKIGDDVKGEESINEAINMLNAIENKDAEVFALFAYSQCLSIQYVRGMQAGMISQSAGQNVKNARKIDENNIRAWYVSGVLDFYTPKSFGGQKECEQFFKKAISLEEKNTDNPYLPTWGKEDSYIMLINYLLVNERKNEAEQYYKEAISAFPSSSSLQELGKYFSN